jgi:hypothetical protein
MLTLTLTLALGGLLSEPNPRSASLLVPDDLLLAQAPVPPSAPGDLAARQARFDLLQSSPAPSLGPPIALLASALAAAGVGVGFLSVGMLASLLAGPGSVAALLVVGVVALLVAAGLGIAGGVWLPAVLRARKARSHELRELQQQVGPASGPAEAPVPPSSVAAPRPSLLLATF